MMAPAEQRDYLTSGTVYVYVKTVGDRSGAVVVAIEDERSQDDE